MSAIDRGKSVDTSMGFTPLEGLLMGTRSGDVDPAAVLYFMEKESLTAQEAGQLLNHNSGLYGVSGIGNDMRAVLEQGRQGHERAQLAVEIFCYRVRKYIGAYLAALNGCDGIIFTGGIGENGPPIRARICDGLSALGIQTDSHRNDEAIGVEKNIAVEGARPEVWVIPTNEELMIARDTLRCILQNRG